MFIFIWNYLIDMYGQFQSPEMSGKRVMIYWDNPRMSYVYFNELIHGYLIIHVSVYLYVHECALFESMMYVLCCVSCLSCCILICLVCFGFTALQYNIAPESVQWMWEWVRVSSPVGLYHLVSSSRGRLLLPYSTGGVCRVRLCFTILHFQADCEFYPLMRTITTLRHNS